MTWHQHAACLGQPAEWWFPGTYSGSNAYANARRICNRCPVKRECLAEAIEHDIEYGMYGGLSPRQRHAINPRRHIT